MTDETRKSHWETVYTTKGETEVSWFQETAAPSLELIELARPTPEAAIADIGGGASRLVDSLLARGFRHVSEVEWVVADVTRWSAAHAFDIWHDRAAFHFLTEPADRSAYIARVRQAVRPGGHVIIGTFAIDGPEKCSGLPVNRYDAAGLAKQLGEGFELLESRRQDHSTPWNSSQRFQFCIFRRT